MIRILISPTRSGSTAFLRCFENNISVEQVYHQPIKSGFRQDGTFDYGFFLLDKDDPSKIFVAKETVGGFQRPEVEFSPLQTTKKVASISDRFPFSEEIAQVKPLFLFRDPFQTWNSINKLNVFSAGKSPFFSPFSYFLKSYQNVFDFMVYAKKVTKDVYCITLELLASDPKLMFSRICDKWNIPYYDQMIDWTLPYGEKTVYSEETKERMSKDPRFIRSKQGLEESSSFSYKPSEVSGVSDEQMQIIKTKVLPIYEQIVSISKKDFSS